MCAAKTLKALYRDLIKQFEAAGIDTPDLDARFIIEERTIFDWSDIVTRPDSPIDDSTKDLILSDAKCRLDGVPLSRIYGQREFWGLNFSLSEDTLDPRPDTELIIDLALQRFSSEKPLRILDLGTGSGCILVSLLSEFPNATGYGVDLSFGAIKMAKHNAHENNCENRAHFICGSWGDAIMAQNPAQSFDLIASNPPYISNRVIPTLSRDVQNHDPILGLDGGDDGLEAYKKIFPQLKLLLRKGGTGLFEIGYDQQIDVMRLAEDAGFALRTVHQDLARNPRVVEISCGDK